MWTHIEMSLKIFEMLKLEKSKSRYFFVFTALNKYFFKMYWDILCEIKNKFTFSTEFLERFIIFHVLEKKN